MGLDTLKISALLNTQIDGDIYLDYRRIKIPGN